jgi:hypothetical protein
LGVDGRGPLRRALRLAVPHLLPGRLDLHKARLEFTRGLRAGAFGVGTPLQGGRSLWRQFAHPTHSPPGLWLDADDPATPVPHTEPNDLWIEGWAPDTEA